MHLVHFTAVCTSRAAHAHQRVDLCDEAAGLPPLVVFWMKPAPEFWDGVQEVSHGIGILAPLALACTTGIYIALLQYRGRQEHYPRVQLTACWFCTLSLLPFSLAHFPPGVLCPAAAACPDILPLQLPPCNGLSKVLIKRAISMDAH